MNRHPGFTLLCMGIWKKKNGCFESRHVLSRRVTWRARPISDINHSESAMASLSMLVELLIEWVRERPAIYDPSDPSHRDRVVIAALWKEVAAALSCTGKTVLSILNHLLGHELYIRLLYFVSFIVFRLNYTLLILYHLVRPWTNYM